MLSLEILLRLEPVSGGAQDARRYGVEGGRGIPEALPLQCAAGCARLWIEKEHQVATAKIGQLERLPAGDRKLDVGYGVADGRTQWYMLPLLSSLD